MSAQPRSSLLLRWLLGLSLALNIALGLAWALPRWGGPAFSDHAHRHAGPPVPSPRELRAAMPEVRRDLVDEVLQGHRPHIRKALGASRKARRALDRLLREDNVSRDQLDAAFAEVRRTEAVAAEAVHGMMRELLVQLSADERRQLAEHMDQRRRHERERRRESR